MKRNFYKLMSGAKRGVFALALLVSGTAAAQLSYTLVYTGAVQTLTLPAGNWGFQCWGADGGDVTAGPGGGGKGGYARGEFNIVTPGSSISVRVGGKGVSASGTGSPAGSGGWNGGGGGGATGKSGGGGGGATDIRFGGAAVANRIIVAGAGGGAAYYNALAVGGNGGGVIAMNGDIITSANVTTIGGGGAGANGILPGLSPNGFLTTNGTANGAGGGGNSPGIGFGQPGATSGEGGGTGGSNGSGSTGGSGGGGAGYAGGAGGTQTANVGAAGGGGSSYVGGVTSGTTIMFGQAGFTVNPDPIGNGRVIITELCNFSLLAANNTNSLNPILCVGQSATLVTNAVNNYSWSTGATTSSIIVSPTSNTVYALTALSNSNCTTSRSISITVSGSIPVLSIANPSNNICLGKTVSLTATGAISYTWANAGIVNGQTFTPVSTAVYTVSGQNGCGITVATTTITVAPLPVSTVANPVLVCQGYPATLSSTASVTGFTWMPTSQTGSVVTVAPTANTIYTVTASDGICSGTQTVLVSTQTTPTIVTSQTLVSICLGQSVNLSASGAGTGGSYSWTPGGAGSAIVLSPSTSTAVVVAGTNSLGCTSTGQQIILVDQPPVLVVTANKPTVCTGDPVILTASGAPIYQWANGPATANFTVNPTVSTVYTVTGSQSTNTCAIDATIAVTAIVPNVTVPSSLAVCEGGSVAIIASGASLYKWNGGANSTNGTYVTTPASSSVFTLVATTASSNVNCLTTHYASVTVNPNPTITITPAKQTICKGETHTLTATGASTYSWSASTSSGSVITVKPTTTTFYTVTGVDANGCEATILYSAKVSNCNGIDESARQQALSIYPNPNNGQFFVSSESAVTLNLINTLGQLIKSIELNSENGFNVEVTGLAKGVYYMSADNGIKLSHTRLIVD